MVEPINLNKARKARAETEAKRKAAENRVKFGRTHGQKANDRVDAERQSKRLDGKVRDPK